MSMSAEELIAFADAYRQGVKYEELAARFGISPRSVGNLVRRLDLPRRAERTRSTFRLAEPEALAAAKAALAEKEEQR